MPPPATPIRIRYECVWLEATTAMCNEPCEGTITITSDSATPPPHQTSIPCTAKFRYADWKAEFHAKYSTANDTFGDDFMLLSMNKAMREEDKGGTSLAVAGIDDRGYQILVLSVDPGYVGCAPTDFELYAKRCVEGEGDGEEEEMRLSRKEKKMLGLKGMQPAFYMNEDREEYPEDTEDEDEDEDEEEEKDKEDEEDKENGKSG